MTKSPCCMSIIAEIFLSVQHYSLPLSKVPLCEALEHAIILSSDDPIGNQHLSGVINKGLIVTSDSIPLVRSSTYRSGENASCPISALIRDSQANHVREPGWDIMQKEFSNEAHSWWRSCVEEQCECFNVRGNAIQDSA
ncbi:hypothetical protein CEXT_70181 [Caerostris extrusa]|uniref:Uncharacterized protein n=1 Tax=Caerostris extrusa TaxID=172846 RepID=A0AAV4X830_CAEEX|nr:hypothetical protein CEXT_70181 [Caerostris extrusa]